MDSVIVTRTEIQRGSNNDIQSLTEAFLNDQDVRESSRKLYGRTLKQFFRWVARENKSLSNLTRVDILQYSEYLENTLKVAPLTIGSYLISVRKFFEWTEAVKLYPNIARGIKTPKRSQTFEKGYLSDGKSKDLLNYFESLSLRDYAIVNLMLRTGLRTIEITRAKIGDICYIGEKRVLKVWGKGRSESEKGRDYNFVVLTEKSYLPIKNYLEASRKGAKSGDPLFASTSHRNHGQQLTTRTVSGLCKDGLKAIGLDGREYTAHSLRHTTACSLLEHGRSLIEVQHVLRHSSPNTTQIYTKMKERELRLREAPEAALDLAF